MKTAENVDTIAMLTLNVSTLCVFVRADISIVMEIKPMDVRQTERSIPTTAVNVKTSVKQMFVPTVSVKIVVLLLLIVMEMEHVKQTQTLILIIVVSVTMIVDRMLIAIKECVNATMDLQIVTTMKKIWDVRQTSIQISCIVEGVIIHVEFAQLAIMETVDVKTVLQIVTRVFQAVKQISTPIIGIAVIVTLFVV